METNTMRGTIETAKRLAEFGDVQEWSPYRGESEGNEAGDCAGFSDFHPLSRAVVWEDVDPGEDYEITADDPSELFILPDILLGGDDSGLIVHQSNYRVFLKEYMDKI